MNLPPGFRTLLKLEKHRLGPEWCIALKCAHLDPHLRLTQRNTLSRQMEKLDLKFRSARLFTGTTPHPLIRFQRIHFMDTRRIIEEKIPARTDTNLQNITLWGWLNALANSDNRLRVSERAYKMRIDAVSAKAHLKFGSFLLG